MELVNYNGTIYNGDYLYIENEIWRRDTKREFYELCLTELAGNILYLTGELCFNNLNFYTNGEKIIDDEDFNDMICICGHHRCGQLFIVYYKLSNIKFAVGSRCIDKFKPEGYETINKDICLICCNKLCYKTSKNNKRNGIKNYPYCNECDKFNFLRKYFKKFI